MKSFSKTTIVIAIIILVGLVGAYLVYQTKTFSSKNNTPSVKITTFKECVEAGNPVMESYPRKCEANGKTFTENIGNVQEKKDIIRLESPKPQREISSPLEIKGEARGTWYFEGSFPVVLTDWDGLIIAEGNAEAQSNWQTEEFVPFKAKLEFKTPSYGEKGSLILRKANPSGLPKNDDALEIPINFSQN